MRYSKVFLDTIAYKLPDEVVTTRDLETQLKALYDQLRIPIGQLEYMTGIRERRWWPDSFKVSQGACWAASAALEQSPIDAKELDVLIYAGVCRDEFEPATACRVADHIGLAQHASVYDISNACLGILNGIVDIANRIELGQARSGMVVSCEQAALINRDTIERMLLERNLESFKTSLATLTGGSGAVAVIVSDGSKRMSSAHRLLGGNARNAAAHHQLCRWGLERQPDRSYKQFLSTDAIEVMQHGIQLGQQTWQGFLEELAWQSHDVDRVITHQVGQSHRAAILKALDISPAKDFASFPTLGNMGTVSLPLTAAMAAEQNFIQKGDRVGLLGIGSGLNCLMLGVEW